MLGLNGIIFKINCKKFSRVTLEPHLNTDLRPANEHFATDLFFLFTNLPPFPILKTQLRRCIE